MTYEEAMERGRPLNLDDLNEIDAVIDRISRTDGWNAVIPQYSGERAWAWHQWKGTILERLWLTVAMAGLMPMLIILAVKWLDPAVTWFGSPDESHRLIAPLLALSQGWNHLLTLSTFVVTFFVGHSHSFWRKSYMLVRVVQGRLNDIGMLCACHARRHPNGELTEESKEFLKTEVLDLLLKMKQIAWQKYMIH